MTLAEEFETLWQENYADVFRYVKRRVLLKETVEDIVQETFAKAWAALRSGQGYTSHARGWLFRIAHNTIIDQYRRRDRDPETIELDAFLVDRQHGGPASYMTEVLTVKEPGPHEVAEGALLHDLVARTLQRLPGNQGAVLAMRVADIYPAEIAETLQMDVGAIKMLAQLKRACIALASTWRQRYR
jgi:RNA polymerase sigma-70 factor, ECF subfamily